MEIDFIKMTKDNKSNTHWITYIEYLHSTSNNEDLTEYE